jgi:uncharacterized phage protein (TIGR01671 family)
MREILFRGKRCDNGEWVQGFYVRADHHWHKHGVHKDWIICGASANGGWFALHNKYAVKAKTVGQFTGLTDKNEKKIFEGDVVKAVIVRDFGDGTENREETGIIVYDKIGMIGLVAEYAGTIPVWSDFFQELTLSGCIDDFWFEVIGNIHDNPELLENP